MHFSNTTNPSIFVRRQREKPVRSTSARLQSYSRPRTRLDKTHPRCLRRPVNPLPPKIHLYNDRRGGGSRGIKNRPRAERRIAGVCIRHLTLMRL